MTTPATTPTITALTGSEADTYAAARVIAAAFAPLDVCRWLVGDDEQRVLVLTDYFQLGIAHAARHGHIDAYRVNGTIGGAGVWLTVPHPDIDNYEQRLAEACGPWTDRFIELEDQMHHAHPTDRGAHSYLVLLGTAQPLQNKGLGTDLLRHRLALLDREGVPSYLEASCSQSRRLYLREGYQDCAEPLDLPYAGERMYPMWRDVRTA